MKKAILGVVLLIIIGLLGRYGFLFKEYNFNKDFIRIDKCLNDDGTWDYENDMCIRLVTTSDIGTPTIINNDNSSDCIQITEPGKIIYSQQTKFDFGTILDIKTIQENIINNDTQHEYILDIETKTKGKEGVART